MSTPAIIVKRDIGACTHKRAGNQRTTNEHAVLNLRGISFAQKCTRSIVRRNQIAACETNKSSAMSANVRSGSVAFCTFLFGVHPTKHGPRGRASTSKAGRDKELELRSWCPVRQNLISSIVSSSLAPYFY